MKLTDKEITNVLEQFSEQIDDLCGSCKLESGILKDYKINIKSKGDHKHDGQMVDYDIILTSPKGKKTKFTTCMSLMCGWNHYQSEIIK